MSKNIVKFSLISDFTVSPLEVALKKQFKDKNLEFFIAPIDQVRQSIDQLCAEDNTKKDHIAVLWTRPQRQVYEFVNLCIKNQCNKELIFNQVKEFSSYIRKVSKVAKVVIVPTWTVNSSYRGNGVLDFKYSNGICNMLTQMNLMLSKEIDNLTNVFLLNADQWIKLSDKAEDEKLWYFGKIPFSISVFNQISEDIKAVYNAFTGKSKKLLVLDLDNTLWGGIIGEDGIQNIRLGGIDYIGEAFLEFQRQVLSLKNRGVLLAICSKNDEAIAMEVINNHSEMILKKDDFVGFKINWEDKAKNIKELALELNLGLDSIVFIDDSQFERARVASELPEVFVPEWPEDPIYFARALNSLKCFDKMAFSDEDSERTKLYIEDQQRKECIKEFNNIDDWLYSVELEVSCELLSYSNVQRVTQLLNKTNQFNLITRRIGQDEIMANCTRENSFGVAFYAKDKFGNYGLIGFSSFNIKDSYVIIEDFLLSCRAMGRGIEKSMLYLIKSIADSKFKSGIYAKYIPTGKNNACAKFLSENGFVKNGDNYYNNKLNLLTNPNYIKLVSDIS